MTSECNAANAYRFCDNFAIISEDGIMFHGCEHNQEEANAIATWITSNTGRKTIVIKNRPDQIAASKAFRTGEPIRFKAREDALVGMGVWKKAKKGRRS